MAGGRFKLGDPETGIITDNEREQIRRMAGIGLAQTKIGYCLGVSYNTWAEFCERNPEVKELLEAGKAQAELQVGAALMKRTQQGDMGAIRWWESTRAGRSEKISTEVTQKNYVIEAPAPMSLEEWEEQNSKRDDVPDVENPT